MCARNGGVIMDAEISVVDLSRLVRESLPPIQIVDVRHAHAFAQDSFLIPGAVRRTPDVDAWHPTLEPWRPIVVYCVHGAEVSRGAAAALAKRGFDARY